MLHLWRTKTWIMKFSEEIPEIDTIIGSLCHYFDKERIEKEAKDTNFIQKEKNLPRSRGCCANARARLCLVLPIIKALPCFSSREALLGLKTRTKHPRETIFLML